MSCPLDECLQHATHCRRSCDQPSGSYVVLVEQLDEVAAGSLMTEASGDHADRPADRCVLDVLDDERPWISSMWVAGSSVQRGVVSIYAASRIAVAADSTDASGSGVI